MKAFTLVEIMVVVVIIGLLAALAIPISRQIRQNATKSEMMNDGRQIGAAAQQYMSELQVSSVGLTIQTNGQVASPLNSYVKQVGRGYSSSAMIEASGTFTLSHALVNNGSPVVFNAEGQLYAP